MEAKFSPRVKDVISYSREEAIRLGHDYIGTEHLLLGLIREGDGKAIKTLRALDIDSIRLKKTIEDAIKGTATNNLNIFWKINSSCKTIYLFTSRTFSNESFCIFTINYLRALKGKAAKIRELRR